MVILRNDEMFFRNTLAGSNILLLKLKLGRDTHTKKTDSVQQIALFQPRSPAGVENMMTHLLSRTHEPSNLASMPTFFRKRSREILARNRLEHLNICASFSTSSRAFRKRRTDIHKLLESDEECNQRSATAICLQGHKQRLYEATSA